MKKGQKNNEILKDMSPEDVTEYLFIAARGIIYNWCLYDGEYDLLEAMNKYMNRLIVIFKNS